MKLIQFGARDAVVDIEVKTEVGVVRGHAMSNGYGFNDVVVESPEFKGEALQDFAQAVLRAKAEEVAALKKARAAFKLALADAKKELDSPASPAELP